MGRRQPPAFTGTPRARDNHPTRRQLRNRHVLHSHTRRIKDHQPSRPVNPRATAGGVRIPSRVDALANLNHPRLPPRPAHPARPRPCLAAWTAQHDASACDGVLSLASLCALRPRVQHEQVGRLHHTHRQLLLAHRIGADG
eukprot:scaffold8581_cov109-Isochrysis_galbana.AAC.4